MALRMQASFDLGRFRTALDAEAERIIRSGRRAVNELAWRAREDVKAEMDRVFDRPTPWVRNGIMIVPATDAGPGANRPATAELDWKPGSVGSVPAGAILKAQIEGGPRKSKRFERALRSIGALPEGLFAVWANGAPLDRFGNLTGGRITKILSDLRAFSEVGFQANRRADGKSRGALRNLRYFAIRGEAGRKLRPGIYEARKRGNPKLVIAFVKAPSYAPRFAPARVAEASARRNRDEVWRLALARQLPFRSLR